MQYLRRGWCNVHPLRLILFSDIMQYKVNLWHAAFTFAPKINERFGVRIGGKQLPCCAATFHRMPRVWS